MVEILAKIKQTLEENGVENVYSAYDAVPVQDKGKFFAVLGFGGYEAQNPIQTQTKIYMPVKCDLTLTVYAPMNTTQEELYGYYHYNFAKTIDSICGLCSRLKSLDVSPDSKLNKLTLKAVVKLNCMKTITL